jgi:hypothetical protein
MRALLCVATVLASVVAFSANNERATNIREATVVASPSGNTEKVMSLERGTSLTIHEQRTADGQPWVKVVVTIPGSSSNAPARESTGWVPAKVVVSTASPNADEVIYGEAVDSEQQAQRRGGRRTAAEDAMRLYYRVAEMFPNSPVAPEAMWRSADIRWQLDRSKGAKVTDDHYLQEVISRFPRTKWSDLAAFDLLDNQLCGEWNGLADCPEKEAALYENYARQHPQSPRFAEALYNAAYRQGGLADIYRMLNNREKSSAAHNKAMAMAQEIAGNPTLGEWSYRAEVLMYKLQQNVPLYGVAEDEAQ